MPISPQARLLDRLEALKGQFKSDAGREAAALLRQAGRTQWADAAQLIHCHEIVSFLRAYPQNKHVLQLADRVLATLGAQVKRLRKTGSDAFEDPATSGITQTGLSTFFSHPFAHSLALRYGNAVSIDWEAYEHPERLGRVLARLIPEAYEDWAIAPHPDWRRWYEKADGSVAWLTQNVQPEVFDLLELPIRLELGDSVASRSRGRIERKRIFFHDRYRPLLTRKDVSLSRELASKAIRVQRLSKVPAAKLIGKIVDASAVRYRELYGFEYPDLANLFHADLGRGMDLYFFGVPAKAKLPSREYVCGMYCKNGVPIGYVECMWTHRKMEIGFNLYYTFRQGETAWLYVRLMKLFRQQFGVTQFSIDPYQLGHENAEAIESGAFWFYYKLGFRPEHRKIAALAAQEMQKIGAEAGYRTRPTILQKLAGGAVVLTIEK